MKTVKLFAAIVVGIALAVFAAHALGWRSDADQWKADRDRWRLQHDSVAALAAREVELRVAAERREAAAVAAADTARTKAARADSSYRAALLAARSEPAPPECVPVVLAYEAVIAKADSTIASLKRAADKEREARLLSLPIIESLKRENTALRQLIDSAAIVIDMAPVDQSPIGLGMTCGLGIRGWDCAAGLTIKIDPIQWIKRLW